MRKRRSPNPLDAWTNDRLALLFDQHGLGGYMRECPVRGYGRGTYHIDFAWNAPDKGVHIHSLAPVIGSGQKIAVEYEGGVFKRGGAHQRSGRYVSDCRKYRKLAMDGWLVLRYTVADMESPALVIEEIKAALGIPNEFAKLLEIARQSS